VAAVQQLLLQEQVGVLTLTGPGGIGKTRLALQVAAHLLDHFVDGVYFISLAPIRDPDLVASAIAQSLGVPEAPGRSLQESLHEYLRDKQLLLVLDNFEQILAAAPVVSALLSACHRLKVLVTSRATLHLYGEQEFPVPPLALPDANYLPALQQDPAAHLSEFAAIDLFCQRARAVNPEFVLSSDNATTIAKLCIGLDGLPLAIELAAARIKLFSPAALLARLNQRLHLLTGGSQDSPRRQRTLRDEIAWSYDLLTTPQQMLLRRLSVFVGGCSLAAAEAVADSDGDLGIDVLNGVTALLDHNLLKPLEANQGEPRFGMLETIHEYGRERLAASGEAEQTHRQHLAFFLSLAEEADPKLRGAEQLVWLQHLEAEYANLQAALAWSLSDDVAADSSDRQLGIALAGALSWFWHIRARCSEARHWCDRALAVSDIAEHSVARARALQGAGVAAQMQGDFAHARLCLAESLVLWQTLENRWGVAYTQAWLALAHHVSGDQESAGRLAEASVALFRALDNSWGIAFALNALGPVVRRMGDYATARSLLEESVMRFRLVGDAFGMADSINELAGVAYDQGDHVTVRTLLEEVQLTLTTHPLLDNKFFRTGALLILGAIARRQADHQAATVYFTQALTVARDVGNQSFVAAACQHLGLLAQAQGDDMQARVYLRTSLELAWAAMGPIENLASLIGCLAVAAHQEQWERAARLAGAVETLRTNLDRPFTPLQAADYERSSAPVRVRRSEPLVAAAWARGETMTLAEAIADALTLLETPITVPSTVASAPRLPISQTYPAGLTAREVEVLRLLAQRLTYPEIATKLVISRRTVNAHVTSIYSKLGVTAREAAIRFAVEYRLV